MTEYEKLLRDLLVERYRAPAQRPDADVRTPEQLNHALARERPAHSPAAPHRHVERSAPPPARAGRAPAATTIKAGGGS